MGAEKGEERKKWRILEALGVLSAVFVAQTLNGFHKWDSVSVPNLRGLLSLKEMPLIFTGSSPAWDLGLKKNSYPAATGNIFLNTTVFYLFKSYLKTNPMEIPAAQLHTAQKSSFHLLTGEKLTGLTHFEMMWKCKMDLSFLAEFQVLNAVGYGTISFPHMWRKTIQHTECRDWFILYCITEGTASFFRRETY